MITRPRLASFVVLSLAAAAPLVAECSDSGFCRMPTPRAADSKHDDRRMAPKGDEPKTTVVTGLRAGLASGNASTKAANDDATFTSVAAMASWKPWSTGTVAAEVPWVRISGDRGTASGIGDALLAINQELSATSYGTWSATAGVRLPTGDDDKLANAPLGYQPGLGSTDVIVALGWGHWGFDARIGYIAALGRNGTPGIELERGDDLAAAAGYTAVIDAFSLRGGLQATHRLDDSTITDGSGGRFTVVDSAGTQVNLQLAAGYAVTRRIDIGLEAAFAMMSREDNAGVDGLTRSRSFAISAAYHW